MKPEDRIVRLHDARAISVRSGGDPDGFPLLALHGTPGSRLKFDGLGAACASSGVRVLAVDRWGYGATLPHARPSLAAFAADMAALADALDIDRFAVLGVSGGGPFAAAVAAMLGDRVAALALVAPVGPMVGCPREFAPGLVHAVCLQALPLVPGLMGLSFGALKAALAVSPQLGLRLVMARAPRPDREIIADPESMASMAGALAEGMRAGVDGAVTDMALFAAAWDVDAERILARSKLWIGLQDANVPLGPARWLASLIRNCEVEECPGEGHFWIARQPEQVVAWVVGAVRA